MTDGGLVRDCGSAGLEKNSMVAEGMTIPSAESAAQRSGGNAFIAVVVSLVTLIVTPWMASRLVTPKFVPLAALAGMALLYRLPLLGRRMDRACAACRYPTASAARWTTLAIWAVTAAYFLFTAWHQHRALFPRLHDEHSYLIQTRMIAAGHLWMPQHPLADFFETFYMLVRPVYASQYFPGTALVNAPFVLLGFPCWTMPLLALSLAVALTYRVATLLIDGAAGLIAAAAAVSAFYGPRDLAIVVLAQTPLTLLGIAMFWMWLKWRRGKSLQWAALLGVCMGLAAITRPLDAIAFAAPVLAAMVLGLWRLTPRQRIKTALAIFVGIAPFAALQGAANRGITGSLWQTPFALYQKRDMPGTGMGFHAFNPQAKPLSSLPQKRQFWEETWAVPARGHTLANLPHDLLKRSYGTVLCTLPAIILGILLLVVPFGLKDRRLWVVLGTAPLFVTLYLFYPFYLIHYTVPLAPVMAVALALAVNVLERGRSAFLMAMVLAACIGSLPEFRHDIHDGSLPAMPVMALAHEQLAVAVTAPAVVLFRFCPADDPNEELVYNDDVIWPDDAPIIRAHDLGSRNVEIARYYALRQPQRRFYLFDRQENLGRSTILVHPLGNAAEYLRRLESGIGG